MQQRAVEAIVAATLRDFRHDAAGREIFILRDGEEKSLEGLKIDGVGRHSEDDARLALRRVAHGAGMANGAVEEDAVDALDVAF